MSITAVGRRHEWSVRLARTLALAGVFATGCTPLAGDRATGPEHDGGRAATVRVALDGGTQATRRVALTVFYATTAGAAVPLASTEVALEPGPRTVPLSVNLEPCLNDATGPRTADGGCPLRMAVSLRTETGMLLDSLAVGPFTAQPGTSVSVPNVVLAIPASIDVQLPDPLRVNDTVQLAPIVRDQDDAPMPGRPITYGSSNPAVASINAAGRVVAVGPGTVTITVTSLTASTSVSRTIAVDARTLTVAIADTLDARTQASATATVRDRNGVAVAGVPVTWTSSSPAIVSVGATTGAVTAGLPGQALLTATAVTALDTLVVTRAVAVVWRCNGVPTATERNGVFTTSETWTTAMGPVVIPDSAIYTDGAVLGIGPGVTVCLNPLTARLAFRGGATLQAIGTVAAPIVVRPRTGTRIRAPSFESAATGSTVRHALFIGAEAAGILNDSLAIAALPVHPVLWDSVRFRQSVNLAVALLPGSTLRGSVIDTVFTASGPIGGALGGAAIQAYRTSTIEDVTIRQCGSTAIRVTGDGVRLLGTRVERCSNAISSDPQVRTNFTPGSEVPVMQQLGSYPMVISGGMFATLLPDSAAQARVLGSGGPDTVLVNEAFLNRFVTGTMTVYGHLPIRVAGRLDVTGNAQVVMRPGASVAMNGQAVMTFWDQASLQVQGTPTRPVRIFPATAASPWDILFFEGQGTSRIANAVIEGGSVGNPWMVWVNDAHRVEIDSSLLRGSRKGSVLSQSSRGVSVRRSVVHEAGRDASWENGAAIAGINLTLQDVRVSDTRGDGIHIGGIMTVDGLEVTGSSAGGLRLFNGYDTFLSTWSRVNLSGNGGFGVLNSATLGFTFSGFWWGDPAGPNGPSGDGVDATVTVLAPASSPWPVTPAPPAAAGLMRGVQRRK